MTNPLQEKIHPEEVAKMIIHATDKAFKEGEKNGLSRAVEAVKDILDSFAARKWESETFYLIEHSERRSGDGVLEVTFDWNALINFLNARDEQIKKELKAIESLN